MLFSFTDKKKNKKRRSLSLANMYLCKRNSERSLAIQNNVPQCTPLISKSLPIYPLLKGNTLLFNKIVRKQKINLVPFY
ncbi:hypothetical protein DXB09_07985 [Bacteroides fragilis]|nr:hypothetical protein DXB09_07985 [Bacteroides fragilis]